MELEALFEQKRELQQSIDSFFDTEQINYGDMFYQRLLEELERVQELIDCMIEGESDY